MSLVFLHTIQAIKDSKFVLDKHDWKVDSERGKELYLELINACNEMVQKHNQVVWDARLDSSNVL